MADEFMTKHRNKGTLIANPLEQSKEPAAAQAAFREPAGIPLQREQSARPETKGHGRDVIIPTATASIERTRDVDAGRILDRQEPAPAQSAQVEQALAEQVGEKESLDIIEMHEAAEKLFKNSSIGKLYYGESVDLMVSRLEEAIKLSLEKKAGIQSGDLKCRRARAKIGISDLSKLGDTMGNLLMNNIETTDFKNQRDFDVYGEKLYQDSKAAHNLLSLILIIPNCSEACNEKTMRILNTYSQIYFVLDQGMSFEKWKSIRKTKWFQDSFTENKKAGKEREGNGAIVFPVFQRKQANEKWLDE